MEIYQFSLLSFHWHPGAVGHGSLTDLNTEMKLVESQCNLGRIGAPRDHLQFFCSVIGYVCMDFSFDSGVRTKLLIA